MLARISESPKNPISSDVTENALNGIMANGPFAAGAVFGGFLSYFLFSLASKERSERVKHEIEREKELQKQLDVKDKRIDELHKQALKLKNPASKGE